MNSSQKPIQEEKEVNQMTQTFIPNCEQILESVRGQMLHELVDEYSVDLLDPESKGHESALADLSESVVELSRIGSLEDLAEFMVERGYSTMITVGLVIAAFRLPKAQERAFLNAIAKI